MAFSYVNFGVVGWCFHGLGVIWITEGQVNNAPAAGTGEVVVWTYFSHRERRSDKD